MPPVVVAVPFVLGKPALGAEIPGTDGAGSVSVTKPEYVGKLAEASGISVEAGESVVSTGVDGAGGTWICPSEICVMGSAPEGEAAMGVTEEIGARVVMAGTLATDGVLSIGVGVIVMGADPYPDVRVTVTTPQLQGVLSAGERVDAADSAGIEAVGAGGSWIWPSEICVTGNAPEYGFVWTGMPVASTEETRAMVEISPSVQPFE